MTLKLSSSAFEDGEIIPAKYTCDGDRKLSPPLAISDVPDRAKSLALIVEDPDIPTEIREARGIDVFVHWVAFNIPADTKAIKEGTVVGVEGLNTAGTVGYTGPCPPPEYEPSEHRYVFTLYALDEYIALEAGAIKKDVLNALEPHVIETATLIGRYSRK